MSTPFDALDWRSMSQQDRDLGQYCSRHDPQAGPGPRPFRRVAQPEPGEKIPGSDRDDREACDSGATEVLRIGQ